MRRYGPLLLVLVALAAAVPASSNALGATAQVVADCNAHGRLTGHYSEATLHTALSTLPTDVAEYTNCADVIRKQLLAQVGDPTSPGPGSGGGSGGSFLPTWVIVLLAVVILGGGGAALAARRRGVG
jgi:hypothetical protein